MCKLVLGCNSEEQQKVTKNKDFGLRGCYTAQRVSEHNTTFQWNLQPTPSKFCKS